ncbi:MAG TPA: CPBP family intramembrane glutamic endopeptidase, partial [Gemmatimonadales bacterium]|nr:CPBP family intramembrane glutamic endopeptidase [Gemmatimonadales bacterium]
MTLLWAAPFLLVAVVAFPLVAIINARRTQEDGLEALSRTALYLQLLVIQLILASLGALAAYGADLPIVLRARVDARTLTTSAGLLTLAVLLSLAFRDPRKLRPELSKLLVPHAAGEWALWTAAMVASAVVEEFAYRGVLFTLASRFFDSWIVPAALSALVFGLTHAAQGWRGVVLSAGFGLGFQLLVLWSGGL